MTVKGENSRGIRNNNPGNIERAKGVRWQGERDEQTDSRFVQFTAAEWGIRAIARTLITYQDKRYAKDGSKIDTIAEIIERWAPSNENDTTAYINAVSRETDIAPREPVDVYQWHDMRAIVCAIIAHECAGYRYPDAVIDSGLIKAGLQPPADVVQGGAGQLAAKASAVVGGAVVSVATVAPMIVAAVPAAKDAYVQVVAAAGPIGELVPWLPTVAGIAVAVGVVVVMVHNSRLRQRLA